MKHLQLIDPARFSEEPWRARTRAALPKRITATRAQARAVVKAAKGSGDWRLRLAVALRVGQRDGFNVVLKLAKGFTRHG